MDYILIRVLMKYRGFNCKFLFVFSKKKICSTAGFVGLGFWVEKIGEPPPAGGGIRGWWRLLLCGVKRGE